MSKNRKISKVHVILEALRMFFARAIFLLSDIPT